MKTDNAAHIGLHVFTRAGLGLAPFSFVGMQEKVYRAHADAPAQPGGCCAYCGTGIRYCCVIESADGRRFVVGTDCVSKTADKGLIKAYKTSPEFRTHQRELRLAKGQRANAELNAILSDENALTAYPHPQGFKDRATGNPLTLRDWAVWMGHNAGTSGRVAALRVIKKTLSA